MAFKTIETQEELDKVIGERLKRERETVEKKYADYETLQEKAGKYDEISSKNYEGQIEKLNEQLKTANEKLAGHDKEVSELTLRATGAEARLLKVQIANENGIPYELADRLTGDSAEDIRKDAEAFSKFVSPQQTPPPLFSGDTTQQAMSQDAQYQELLDGILGQ